MTTKTPSPPLETKDLELLEQASATFQQLKREPAAAAMEPLPGWLARRRRNLPPARQVLAAVPAGPVKR